MICCIFLLSVGTFCALVKKKRKRKCLSRDGAQVSVVIIWEDEELHCCEHCQNPFCGPSPGTRELVCGLQWRESLIQAGCV